VAKLLIKFNPAPGQDSAMEQYREGVQPLLGAIGATPVKPSRIVETVAGEQSMAMSIVMDFANADALSAVFASEAYLALIPLRDVAFSDIEILITQDSE
jgi:uncharacterized protein (DUF1330 family)